MQKTVICGNVGFVNGMEDVTSRDVTGTIRRLCQFIALLQKKGEKSWRSTK